MWRNIWKRRELWFLYEDSSSNTTMSNGQLDFLEWFGFLPLGSVRQAKGGFSRFIM